MGRDRNATPAAPDIPALEWGAAGIGLLLTLAILAVMIWQTVATEAEPPPAIEVRVERVSAAPSGFAVEVELRNRSPATAARVEVQGELRRGSRIVETSTATVDYVPGHSSRWAGLYFRGDPRAHQLGLRVLGYSEP